MQHINAFQIYIHIVIIHDINAKSLLKNIFSATPEKQSAMTTLIFFSLYAFSYSIGLGYNFLFFFFWLIYIFFPHSIASIYIHTYIHLYIHTCVHIH
ncbi:hypothetical protein CLU79DRAFT_539054 [Phycomyces nitens]|nr:hypothetical protein CLU79DRAFT_539054 [Phycomyces nitens]